MPSRDPGQGHVCFEKDPEWMPLRDSRTARRRGVVAGVEAVAGTKGRQAVCFGLAEDLRCPGERRCWRSCTGTGPERSNRGGLYSCLWVFLRTGTMPITCPSFTHPSLPAKAHT